MLVLTRSYKPQWSNTTVTALRQNLHAGSGSVLSSQRSHALTLDMGFIRDTLYDAVEAWNFLPEKAKVGVEAAATLAILAVSAKFGLPRASSLVEPVKGLVSSLPGVVITGRAGIGKLRKVLDANEAALHYVTDLIPQKVGSELDYAFGGSAAANKWAHAALDGKTNVSILDSSKFPNIVTSHSIRVPAEAATYLRSFVRQIHDVDLFPVSAQRMKFQSSPPVWKDDHLPSKARTVFSGSEFDQVAHATGIRFSEVEVAALETAGRTTFVLGPKQLLINKVMQTLRSYDRNASAKYTGDFDCLYGAASKMYPKQELFRSVRQAIEEHIRADRELQHPLKLPSHQAADNIPFNNFVRTVLEEDPDNGRYLAALKIGSSHVLQAMAMLKKLDNGDGKQAVTDFLNKHSQVLDRMSTRGTLENDRFVMQGGFGDATAQMMSLLGNLGNEDVRGQIDRLNHFLDSQFHLPALESTFYWNGADDPRLRFFLAEGGAASKHLREDKADKFLTDLAMAVTEGERGRVAGIFSQHGVDIPPGRWPGFYELFDRSCYANGWSVGLQSDQPWRTNLVISC